MAGIEKSVQEVHSWLRCCGIKAGLFVYLAISGVGFAAAAPAPGHAGHGNTAAATATAPPVDRQKMWKNSLARQPLAATATFDAHGRLWLATVKDGRVMVSHSDDRGKTYSTPVAVNAEPEYVAADGENRPKILADGNGHVYVSYTQSLETPFAGNVRFSRSTDGGKSFSKPVTVNDNLDLFTHRFDAMAINSQGQVHITWLDKRDAAAAQKRGEKYSGIAVYYAVSEDGGASFKPNVKVVDHTCECCRIAMAMDVDGYPVIAWRHIYDSNIRDHALVKLDGKMAPARLSRENWEIAACPHHGPSLSIAADGLYHATWFSGVPEKLGLFYAYSGDQGKTFTTPLKFGNPDAQPAHPYVLSLGKRVYLAWKEFDGERTHILGTSSGDAGKSWSAPEKLAATADVSDSPLLVSDGNRVYLSWNTKNEGYRLIEFGGKSQ